MNLPPIVSREDHPQTITHPEWWRLPGAYA